VSRVLVVVDRYGAEVDGAAASQARLAARVLARRHEVEVATTTALDERTWAPHYRAGRSSLDGISIRRFAGAPGRGPEFEAFAQRVQREDRTLSDELAWPRQQGPHVPALLEFLHRDGGRYGAIVFYGYRHEPTALGLPLVPERSALVPAAQDEWQLRLAPYRALFHLPRAIGFLTPEEAKLVRAVFRNDQVPGEPLGVALDPPRGHDARAFRRRHGITGRLLVYIGEVTEADACDELIAMWVALKERRRVGGATLVLAGAVRMSIPERGDVRALGWLTDEERFGALAAADVLVLPSHREALGIVLLEAWQVGTPVLVPSSNPVTAGRVTRSGGGLSYATPEEFAAALERLFRDGPAYGERGRAWVERECSDRSFEPRLEALIELVSSGA
jgi:glycosyltransferase involved in cell wall biosynthesis